MAQLRTNSRYIYADYIFCYECHAELVEVS